MDNRRRLFVASCAALVANAMAFSICTDIMGDFERYFRFTKGQVGEAVSWGAIGSVAMLFIGGALLDWLGIGTALWLAFGAHLCGLTVIILARGFWPLAVGWLFMAVAGGLVEASVNPLAATTYPDRKTHMLNVLHAWWPGGLIIGGLAAYGFTALLKTAGASPHLQEISWQIKMAFVYVPVAAYAALIYGQKFPKTERAQAGVSASAMFKEALRPMFLVLVFCMFLTASTELGPNRWVGVFIQDIVGIRGVLFLVYTSGLMFALRFFAGPVAHLLSPVGMMAVSAALSALGLLALSFSTTVATVFLSATIFGVGVTYFWPTMLGITSERFPKGGALLLGIIGGAGGLFLSYVTIPGMGRLHDNYTLRNLPPAVAERVVVGGRVDEGSLQALPESERKTAEHELDAARRAAAAVTFRWVAVLPSALILVFGAMFLRDRARGGYKQEVLAGPGGG